MDLIKAFQKAQKELAKAETVTAAVATVSTTAAAPASSALAQGEELVRELATVAGAIPGLQSSTLAQLLTLSVQIVNVVEAIKNDVQTAHPEVWAELEATFSSAVQAWDQIPKK